MKIAITAQGKTLDAAVDSRFGRASYFIVVDTETMDYEVIENGGVQSAGGAGIGAAQAVIDAGVQAVLTGHCGPNAFRTLQAGQVRVYTGIGGTVQQAVEQYLGGQLRPDEAANVQSHAGMEPQNG